MQGFNFKVVSKLLAKYGLPLVSGIMAVSSELEKQKGQQVIKDLVERVAKLERERK